MLVVATDGRRSHEAMRMTTRRLSFLFVSLRKEGKLKEDGGSRRRRWWNTRATLVVRKAWMVGGSEGNGWGFLA